MSKIFEIQNLDNAAFLRHKKALLPVVVPIEQSPEWGYFNDSISNRKFLGSFAYNDEKKLIAIASATLYRERGRDWIWIKHGPLFATEPNKEVINKMCSTLQHQFKNISNSSPLFIRLSLANKVPSVKLPFEHTMYDETVILNLKKSESELLSDMNQSGRRGIRKATKSNVVVVEVTKNIIQTFESDCYPILKETGDRDGFGIHPLALYTNMLRKLPKHTRLYVAKKDDTVIAWALTTEYSNQSTYYYGGSNSQAHQTSAAYLLHWDIIKAMKQRGNVSYDFMGIAGEHFKALQKVTQFKLKFSKEITKISPTFDLPIRSLQHAILGVAVNIKRRLS